MFATKQTIMDAVTAVWFQALFFHVTLTMFVIYTLTYTMEQSVCLLNLAITNIMLCTYSTMVPLKSNSVAMFSKRKSTAPP